MPIYVTLIKWTDAWVSASRFVAVCGPLRFAIDVRSRALGDGSRRFVCKLKLSTSGRDVQQERIDLATREPAEMSERLQAAARALRQSDLIASREMPSRPTLGLPCARRSAKPGAKRQTPGSRR